MNYMERVATAVEENDLLQDSLKGEEEKEHKEEEGERTDHPLTYFTSNITPIFNTHMLVLKRLVENALVLESKARRKTVVPEYNHLQGSQDKEEEHHEGEVDKERHTTNTEFVDDASLSSNDSYYAKTVDNCSEEDLCLDTHLESINNDELEIEPCYELFDTNMQGQECYENSSTDELASKSDKFVSNGEEIEEESTVPLLQNKSTMKCSPTKVAKVKI